MHKKEARKIYRQKRDAMPIIEKLKWDDLILIQLQTIELPFLSLVLSFYPLEDRNELDTFIITDYLHFRNPALRIAYPKTDPATNTMKAIGCTADTSFEVNEYNIPEPVHDDEIDPAEIDLVLIPLLAFDKKGFRVGYGKGFYDRFLKNCNDHCIKLGLSYFDPIESIEGTDEYDVPLDLCITPHQVYVF
jgi:5-formyltetrahydrofolate cyclo-ligase